MSRTDKDRPWWVQNFQDGPELYDHDHRSGKCIEESLDYAKWSQHRGRHRDCKKYLTWTEYCTKAEAYVGHKKNPHPTHGERNYGKCWVTMCDHRPYNWVTREHHYTSICSDAYRHQCAGHREHRWDYSIPCTCDDFPPRPTCDRIAVDNKNGSRRWRYTWGGVPSEFVRTYYHKPERARERNLHDYVREYNTYGDLEDGDFENRQARNSARWIYW